MSTTTRQDHMPLDEDQSSGQIPPALAGPNAKTKPETDQPKTWDVMRGQRPADEVHPYWVHTTTASGVTLMASCVVSLMATAWWGWIVAFLILFLLGATLGSALTARASRMLNWLGTYAGAAWGVGIGALGMVMQAVNFHGHLLDASARPAWLAWIALAVMGSVVHRWIWGRVAEISDPNTPRGAEYRAKRNGGLWEHSFREAGFGEVTITSVTDKWCGVDVVFRTDPNRTSSFQSVKSGVEKVVDIAHKRLREEGEENGLGMGQVEVMDLEQRDEFALRVRTRDPLKEKILPAVPTDAEFPVRSNAVNIHLGYWDTGDEMSAPAAGPQKFGVGTTGSGKSTWLTGLQVGYARRPHWTMWGAGISKLMDMIGPCLSAAEQVGGDPIFEMWGGGDSGAKGELNAAERIVYAAYLLYLDRAERNSRNKLSGRDGKNFVGAADCPWVAVFLDEVDKVVKASTRKFKLPNGSKMDLWGMLSELGSVSRTYGIELIYATQRATNDWFGGRSVNNLVSMCNTRFVFRTSSGADIQDMIKDQQAAQKAKKLEKMQFACMATVAGDDDQQYRYGKCELWEDEDLVTITEMANRLGTLTTIGPEDRRALGDLYTRGAQSTEQVATISGGSDSSADTSKWGAADRSEERQRIADELLSKSGGTSRGTDDEGQEADHEEENGAEDFEQQARAEIDALVPDVLTDSEVEALRESYGERYPESPEELLGALLDAWGDLDEPPTKMTAGEMVKAFDLHWLDRSREDRDSEVAVVGQAASALGSLLQGDPIHVYPRSTNRGKSYDLGDLRAAYERIMEE